MFLQTARQKSTNQTKHVLKPPRIKAVKSGTNETMPKLVKTHTCHPFSRGFSFPSVEFHQMKTTALRNCRTSCIKRRKKQREDSVIIPIRIFSLPVEPASNSLRLLIVWKGITFPWRATMCHLLH